jgi:hypothetical protein
MTATETTKAIREALKTAGIAAKCRKYESCGVTFVTINPPAYGVEFSETEQGIILTICKVLGLTLSRGMAINVEQRTYFHGFTLVKP